MAKLDGLIVFVAVATAALVIVSSELLPAELQTTPIARDPHGLAFFLIWTLASLPMACAMPRVTVRFFGRIGRMWRLPSSTYVVPRWFVRTALGSMVGQVVGLFVLAIVYEHRIFWEAGSFALLSAAFCAGAWRRLKTHPGTEFTMPWWPRP